MAIVNHTGNIVANETWAAADEHHVTGDIKIVGGASGNPIVVNIEAGVNVNMDGYYFLFYAQNLGVDYGRVNMVGTEVDKIEWRPDPTIYGEGNYSNWTLLFHHCWKGFLFGSNMIYDLDWVKLRQANYLFRLLKFTSTTDNYATVNNVHLDACEMVIDTDVAVPPGNIAADNWLEIDGLLLRGMCKNHTNAEGIRMFLFGAGDITGRNNWKNVAIVNATGHMITVDAASKLKFYFENWLIGLLAEHRNMLEFVNMDVGEYIDVNLKGMFLDGPMCPKRYGLVGGTQWEAGSGIVIPNRVHRTAGWTIEDSVIYRMPNDGISVINQQGYTYMIQNIDFIENLDPGLKYDSAVQNLTIDGLYFKNNYGADGVASGVDPRQGQWWDQTDAQAPTNVQATPIFPLDVENVIEGAPDADSITITFDAETGSTGKRLLGIPFIKYGTTSGVYTSIAGNPPFDKAARYEAFAKWNTSYGTFAQAGHSVTISNLKAGTTYYYKCCFIDPLGRIAEGTEGSFTTTGSAGGKQGPSPGLERRV